MEGEQEPIEVKDNEEDDKNYDIVEGGNEMQIYDKAIAEEEHHE